MGSLDAPLANSGAILVQPTVNSVWVYIPVKAMKPSLMHAFLILSIAFLSACGGDGDDGRIRNSQNVDGAADHLSEAFAGSDSALQKHAKAASEAMRKKKYRDALISLQEIKLSGKVKDVNEGIAVRDSLINLEQELIYAMEDGDPNAAKAYQLLKRVNQN